jgi:hypothetical protein
VRFNHEVRIYQLLWKGVCRQDRRLYNDVPLHGRALVELDVLDTICKAKLGAVGRLGQLKTSARSLPQSPHGTSNCACARADVGDNATRGKQAGSECKKPKALRELDTWLEGAIQGSRRLHWIQNRRWSR